MKKILVSIVSALMLFSMLNVAVFAASPEVDISGPDGAYANDKITFTAKIDVNDAEIYAVSFNAVYDSSKLTYVSSGDKLSGWEVNESDNGNGNILFLCNYNSDPVTSDKTLVKLTFKVNSSVKKGDDISVAFKNVVLTSLDQEYSAKDASCNVTVKEKSSDCTLSSLSISGIDISPKFSPDVTKYTAEFEYRTEKLSIRTETNDSSATVSVSGNRSFKEGKNTITVTVTAEDGTKKDYVITATMGANPNPQKDSNSKISSIDLSQGELDKEFSPSVYEYNVTVSADVNEVVITPTAESKKAVCEAVTVKLGDGTVAKLVCKAEDGSTSTYTFTFVKFTENETDTSESEPIESDTKEETSSSNTEEDPQETTEEITTETTEITPSESEKSDETTQPSDTTTHNGISKPVPLWVVLVCSIVSLAIGAAVSAIIFKRKF